MKGNTIYVFYNEWKASMLYSRYVYGVYGGYQGRNNVWYFVVGEAVFVQYWCEHHRTGDVEGVVLQLQIYLLRDGSDSNKRGILLVWVKRRIILQGKNKYLN